MALAKSWRFSTSHKADQRQLALAQKGRGRLAGKPMCAGRGCIVIDTPKEKKKKKKTREKPIRVSHPYPLTYSPQDLADRLGVTRRYLYDLLKHPDPSHRLPAPFKMGRASFWRVQDVQDWIDRRAGQTAA
jgi:predicted DNA-binding transcriptional regulator AlpA